MRKKSKTDWAYIDAMQDDEIDYSEIPKQGEEFFRNAVVIMPQPKVIITLRIDRDVLEWLKKQGRGYQTRINALLRAYMKAQKEHNTTKNKKR